MYLLVYSRVCTRTATRRTRSATGPAIARTDWTRAIVGTPPMRRSWQPSGSVCPGSTGGKVSVFEPQSTILVFNRYSDFYDIHDGEWGWFDTNIDEDREQFIVREIPLTTDKWFFNVFSISKTHGIGIIDNPIAFDSIRPVHFLCEGPHSVHRGESIGIRCMIMNRSPYDIETVIILNGSPDYEFIHVEEYGLVKSYDPRTSSGDHHHLVYVRGEDEIEVHLPIKPMLKAEQGMITVSISLSTQIMSKTCEVEIQILPEGSIVHRHTSILLDLKSRAFELQFMDIIVDETPLIPYEIYRRYIYGSATGRVSISGDVVGPTFIDNEPVNLSSTFPDGN